MALTRIKTNQITDLAVTTAKLAANSVTAGKLANNLTYGSDFTVTGNLTVSGTTTSVSTTNTRVEDAIIALSAEATGSASVDSGLLINRGADDNQAMIWDESADQFIFANVGSEDGDTAGNVNISSYAGLQAGAIVYGSLNDGTTTVSSTAAELNLVDGSTAGTIVNSKAVIYGAAGEVNATKLQVGGVDITATPAEINVLAGVTAGTVLASGGVVVDSNKDIGSFRNLTATGAITGGSFVIGSADISEAELETIDGVTAGTASASKALVLDGSSDISGINDISAAGLTLSDLTDNRIVIAGTSGLLEDSASLTFDGTTFEVGTAFDVVSSSGNTTIGGTLDVTGKTSLDGAVDLGDGAGDAIAVLGTATFTPSAAFNGGFTVAASQTIDVGANKITNMADPASTQDAATKAYVDSEVSSASVLAIAGDSGTDNVTVGSDTFTFSGTANEVTTAVTNNTLTIGLPSDVHISNDLTIAGNLTVSGTTTTLSTTNSVVSDSLIELNSGAGSNANDLGLIFERGSTGDNAVFAWDESVDKFTLGTTTATGASTGDLTITAGTLVAALEGNASTATALATARNIAIAGDQVGTASFDGTGDISITVATQNDSVDLGTHTTGNYVATIADAGNSAFTIVNGTAEGGAVTIDIAANAVALGTQTTGNYVATIADAGSGRITVANSGTETAAITLDIAANAVTMGTHTAGDYVATITGGAGIASTGATSGETIAHSLSVDLTDTNIFASDGTASRAVVLDSNGDFTARNITATDIDGILGSNTAAAATVTTLNASDLASLDGGIDVDGAFVVANTTGNISTTGTAIIGSATATSDVTLKVDATDSMMVPVGTTGDRPTTGVTGMFRFNSTVGGLEYHDGSSWEGVSSDFTLASSQTFSGDDSTVAFTLSSLTGSDSYTVAGVLVMLNGVVQEPTTVYGITGTTLTFTTAPATGDLIEVRKFTTTTTVTALADLDGDTQIQVEESADEDVIRFDIAGSEKMTLDSSGVAITGDLSVTGSFTLGDNAAVDTVTIQSTFDGDIVPNSDSTHDLGSSSARYAEAHIDDIILGPQGDVRFSDSDASNYVAFQAPATVASNVTWTLPAEDAGTSGFALVSDASGTLSWAAAGATTTSDTTTNAEEQIYFGDITSGAVTAMHHDSDLTYNPSTGSLSSDVFIGALTGNADTATALATARAIQSYR
jgi:hypothetical protein